MGRVLRDAPPCFERLILIPIQSCWKQDEIRLEGVGKEYGFRGMKAQAGQHHLYWN